MNIRQYLRSSILIALVSFVGISQAAVFELIKIGTLNGTPNPINNLPGSPDNGPGMAPGQKFVVKISYESTSTVLTRDVLMESLAPSGQDMFVIELNGGSNTLDIFVPMEGLDSGGTPFIYTQDESDHFFLGGNAPPIATLNFAFDQGVSDDPSMFPSFVSDTSNIIGVEFEGNFVTGAHSNIIELFNTVANATDPINEVAQANNLAAGLVTRETNGLADAVDVTVDDGAVTYNAASLLLSGETTNLTVQSNDLGAGRSDGETFLDSTWTESGDALPGTLQLNGVDIKVAIENSGLTNTTSSASWDLTLTEQMTGLGDSALVLVDYANAAPSSSLSATATASGYNFAFSSMDADLVVNALIAGFELLTFGVLVDGSATTLFDTLITNGTLSLTTAALLAEFGGGSHTLAIMVTDLAGAQSMSSANFNLDDIPPIPIPPAFALMLTALAFLGVTGRFRRRSS
jgi:hypothetical protein